MSNPHNAAPYVDPILPGSKNCGQIRMTELRERAADVERMIAISRDLPPMSTGNPPMHTVARAMIAVADEARSLLALTELNPDDSLFPHTAAAEAEARRAASQAVSAAVDVLKTNEANLD